MEEVLAKLESESHHGAAPLEPQVFASFCSHSDAGCVPCGVAKPPPPMPRRLELPLPSRCFLANASVYLVLELEPRMHGGQSARFDVLPVEVARRNALRSYRRCSRPMPRRLKQRARNEGTEWVSEPRCCSAVKKVSARTCTTFTSYVGNACPLHSQ